MTEITQAIVWIDCGDARILYVRPDATGGRLGSIVAPGCRIWCKPFSDQGSRAIQRHVFFQKIANMLAAINGFVVSGRVPHATDFVRHVRQYDPRLTPRLSAVEPLDEPTDDRLAELARRYFRQAGQLTP